MSEPKRPALVEKLIDQRERHQHRSRIARIGIMVVGVVVLLAGVVMLITPGPAFVLIPVGLAILSLEFSWAERLLERALVEADKAQARARETTTRQRVVSGVLTVLVIAALVVAYLLVPWTWLPGK